MGVQRTFTGLYTPFQSWRWIQSIHEQLKAAQRRRIRREKAFKKARALGLTCISGGKSQKGAVNG